MDYATRIHYIEQGIIHQLIIIDNGIIQYARKNRYAVHLQLIQYCKSIILQ